MAANNTLGYGIDLGKDVENTRHHIAQAVL